MPERKEVGFLGIKMQDICIYTAAILTNLRYQVLIVDQSDCEEMRHCIPVPDSSIDIVTYKNVDYLFHQTCDKENMEAYDFVFSYFGSQLCEDMTCQELILVTDTEKSNILYCKAMLGQLQMPVSLIVRNACENKVNRAYFRELFAEYSCFLVDKFVLSLDLMDEEYRICMQYEPYHDFKYISQDMKHTLTRIVAGLTDKESVDIRRAYEFSRKGRNI